MLVTTCLRIASVEKMLFTTLPVCRARQDGIRREHSRSQSVWPDLWWLSWQGHLHHWHIFTILLNSLSIWELQGLKTHTHTEICITSWGWWCHHSTKCYLRYIYLLLYMEYSIAKADKKQRGTLEAHHDMSVYLIFWKKFELCCTFSSNLLKTQTIIFS